MSEEQLKVVLRDAQMRLVGLERDLTNLRDWLRGFSDALDLSADDLGLHHGSGFSTPMSEAAIRACIDAATLQRDMAGVKP